MKNHLTDPFERQWYMLFFYHNHNYYSSMIILSANDKTSHMNRFAVLSHHTMSLVPKKHREHQEMIVVFSAVMGYSQPICPMTNQTLSALLLDTEYQTEVFVKVYLGSRAAAGLFRSMFWGTLRSSDAATTGSLVWPELLMVETGRSLFFLKERLRWTLLKAGAWSCSVPLLELSFVTNGGAITCSTSASTRGSLSLPCSCDQTRSQSTFCNIYIYINKLGVSTLTH